MTAIAQETAVALIACIDIPLEAYRLAECMSVEARIALDHGESSGRSAGANLPEAGGTISVLGIFFKNSPQCLDFRT